MSARNYSSISPITTLSSAVSSSATTMTVASTGPWPAVPFTLLLSYDTANEEIVDVTAASVTSSTTFTVTRGVDGSTAKSHAAGSLVRHGISGRDFQEAGDHITATTSVHGIADTSALVLGSDARLSNARTPVAHASSHGLAGSDPVTVAQSQVSGLATDLAGKVDKTLVDAKGDLVTATADNTPARLGVGTNGFVLTADSAEATGLKWAAASGGGGLNPFLLMGA